MACAVATVAWADPSLARKRRYNTQKRTLPVSSIGLPSWKPVPHVFWFSALCSSAPCYLRFRVWGLLLAKRKNASHSEIWSYLSHIPVSPSAPAKPQRHPPGWGPLRLHTSSADGFSRSRKTCFCYTNSASITEIKRLISSRVFITISCATYFQQIKRQIKIIKCFRAGFLELV